MGRVLVAVPGSDVDGDAIREALGLLRPDEELLFLTVYQGVAPTVIADSGIGAPVVLADDAWDEMDTAAREGAGNELRATLAGLNLHGLIRVETGDPADRICAVALEEHVDLIVMGSHHSGVLRRLLGGSVADDVTHHAPCPVLLTRHQAATKTAR